GRSGVLVLVGVDPSLARRGHGARVLRRGARVKSGVSRLALDEVIVLHFGNPRTAGQGRSIRVGNKARVVIASLSRSGPTRRAGVIRLRGPSVPHFVLIAASFRPRNLGRAGNFLPRSSGSRNSGTASSAPIGHGGAKEVRQGRNGLSVRV